MVRTWTVDESFVLDQVRLGLTAIHERRDDLWAELESPSGTRVTLLDDDGASGTAFQHYDLLLSDRAALSFSNEANGNPDWPYEDWLARPVAPLLAFQGENATGTWTLRITEPITDAGFALTATGDLNGTGRWTFEQDGPEVVITYDWRVSADKPLLRRLTWLLRPVFAANHRWAMDRGEESLRLELRRRRATTDARRDRVPPPPPATFAWLPAGRRPA